MVKNCRSTMQEEQYSNLQVGMKKHQCSILHSYTIKCKLLLTIELLRSGAVGKRFDMVNKPPA